MFFLYIKIKPLEFTSEMYIGVFVTDLTILLTSQVQDYGLLGLSLYFSNIVEDITYYSHYQHFTYAFVIDTKGNFTMFLIIFGQKIFSY